MGLVSRQAPPITQINTNLRTCCVQLTRPAMMQGELCVSRLAVLTPKPKSTARLKLFQKLSRSCSKAPRRRLWRWLCEPFDNFLAAQYYTQLSCRDGNTA